MIGGFDDRRVSGQTASDRVLDRRSPAAAQAIAEGARHALGATVVNVAALEPGGTVGVIALSAEPGERYERALAVARTVMPGIDPMRVRFAVGVNPFVRAVHVDGRTMVGPFAEAAHGVVHPWVVRFTIVILDLRWTLSVPLRSRGSVVGSFTTHFVRQPTEAQRAAAAEYARVIEAALDRARA
jgi:GAF domain-containing protein